MEQQEREHPVQCRANRPHQFSYENGILVTKIEPGRAEGVLNVSENSLNPHGMVHGGALAAPWRIPWEGAAPAPGGEAASPPAAPWSSCARRRGR